MTARPSSTAALVAFLLGFLGLVAYMLLSMLLVQYNVEIGAFRYVVSILCQALGFAVPALVYYARVPHERQALRLKRLDPLCALLIMLAAFVGMLALNWISTYWSLALSALGLVVDTGNSSAPRTGTQLVFMLAATAMAPALCEELLFRGFLLPALEPMGRRKAILLSGCMFALLHGRIEALPAHLLLGCMLGALVLVTGSIYASMLYHAIYNAAIMIVAFSVARIDGTALDVMPTVAECIESLPSVIFLTGVWLLLLYAAMRRGMRTQSEPLPNAEAVPLPKPSRVLLAASVALLALVEIRALLRMLPGGGL